MIIVDRALEQRQKDGRPVRVAMIGAGFMARGIALQIIRSVPGMELVGIANRNVEGARRAYAEAGLSDVFVGQSLERVNEAIARSQPVITEDPFLLCRAAQVDAIIEVTGTIEFAARVVLEAIANAKHVVLMNAELDGTLGPILKVHAERNNVIFTNCDGDQPGVILNLYRFVKGLGVRPVLCGNIKGLQDPYRNPTTQQPFAQQWKQKAHMVTSFADGTKISFEQAIVANATGMRVGKRGMYGPTVPTGTSIEEAGRWYPEADLLEGAGIVDYVVGAAPSPGVFVLGVEDHPAQKHYLNLYKLGAGPFYCFYTPYHLCHFEVPTTVARAVLFRDAAIQPIAGPRVDVITTAKIDLQAGQILDGMGFYMTYGQCENYEIARAQNLLPIGLAEGCRLRRNIGRDEVLSHDDVDIPEGRLADRLRAEQTDYFEKHAAV